MEPEKSPDTPTNSPKLSSQAKPTTPREGEYSMPDTVQHMVKDDESEKVERMKQVLKNESIDLLKLKTCTNIYIQNKEKKTYDFLCDMTKDILLDVFEDELKPVSSQWQRTNYMCHPFWRNAKMILDESFIKENYEKLDHKASNILLDYVKMNNDVVFTTVQIHNQASMDESTVLHTVKMPIFVKGGRWLKKIDFYMPNAYQTNWHGNGWYDTAQLFYRFRRPDVPLFSPQARGLKTNDDVDVLAFINLALFHATIRQEEDNMLWYSNPGGGDVSSILNIEPQMIAKASLRHQEDFVDGIKETMVNVTHAVDIGIKILDKFIQEYKSSNSLILATLTLLLKELEKRLQVE